VRDSDSREILEFCKNDVVFYLGEAQRLWGGEHVDRGARVWRSGARSGDFFDPSILAGLRKIEPTLMTGVLYDGQLADP
jgi:hypothetical protein